MGRSPRPGNHRRRARRWMKTLLTTTSLTVSTGAAAEALSATFKCFVQRITPPQGEHACREFVAWFESLIGDDVPLEDEAAPPDDLGIVRQILARPATLRERDLTALNALGMCMGWCVADEVACAPVPFATFWDRPRRRVESATYRLPLP